MIPLIDFQDRCLKGPVMKADEFDLAFSMKVRELVSKYNIEYHPEESICDDATADAVFEAGIDLLVDIGLLNTDTNRVIKYTRAEIEDLAKGGYIGNMHLTDNFGYQDDHLALCQGNVPITEVVSILKKYGYDKALTTEPGADASTDLSDFHGLMKAWKLFGAHTYSGGAPMRGGQEWGQVQNSYFGQNQPPYFVFGAYSPSNDWTLWSQTPME